MKIEEQVLSREQMAHLKELGVDTSDASMMWVNRKSKSEGDFWYLQPNNQLSRDMLNPTDDISYWFIPTYTIGDLIEKLPKRNDEGSRFDIYLGDKTISYVYTDVFVYYGEYNNLIYGLYNCLCWVAENHKEIIK